MPSSTLSRPLTFHSEDLASARICRLPDRADPDDDGIPVGVVVADDEQRALGGDVLDAPRRRAGPRGGRSAWRCPARRGRCGSSARGRSCGDSRSPPRRARRSGVIRPAGFRFRAARVSNVTWRSFSSSSSSPSSPPPHSCACAPATPVPGCPAAGRAPNCAAAAAPRAPPATTRWPRPSSVMPRPPTRTRPPQAELQPAGAGQPGRGGPACPAGVDAGVAGRRARLTRPPRWSGRRLRHAGGLRRGGPARSTRAVRRRRQDRRPGLRGQRRLHDHGRQDDRREGATGPRRRAARPRQRSSGGTRSGSRRSTRTARPVADDDRAEYYDEQGRPVYPEDRPRY